MQIAKKNPVQIVQLARPPLERHEQDRHEKAYIWSQNVLGLQ